MSPELDLLDVLLGQDETLYVALLTFGKPDDEAAWERARNAVTMQVKEGLVNVICKSAVDRRVLQDWEVHQVLNDKSHWLKRRSQAEYFVSLTDKGAKYMGY